MTRLLAWSGIALAVSYLVFVGGAGAGLYTADLRIATIAIAGLALGCWAVVTYRRPSWRPKSVLLPAILASIASLTIATVFSRVPRVSAEYLAFSIVLAALYLLLVRLLANPFFLSRLLTLATTLFLIIGVAFIVRVVGKWIYWWDAVGTVTTPPLRPEFENLTFGNPSNVVIMAALLTIPTIARISWSTRRGVIWTFTVLAITAVVALLSGSRSAWLALAAAAAVAGLLGIAMLRSTIRERSLAELLPRSRGLRFTLIAAVAAAAALALALTPTILRRATEGGEELRLTFVAIALRLFQESPLTGTGLGSWVVERIRYTQPQEIDYYIPHAHNIYAQTLAEQGLVGAAAGLVLVLSLVWLLRDAIRGGEPTRRQWGVATLVGLTYFAVHQSLDFMVNLPAVMFAVAIPVAYLDATASRGLPLPRLGGRAAKVMNPAAVAVTALALGGLLLQELPARSNDAAVALANEGNWESARSPALDAARADPDIGTYPFNAALTEAHAGNHAAAAVLFRRIAIETDLPEAWLNLAAEDLAAGNRADVPASLKAALRLGRQRPAVSMASGDLALRIGDHTTALDSFVTTVLWAPSILADPWWQAESDRAAILPAVIAQAMAAASPERRWEITLMSGDAIQAAALAPDSVTRDFIAAWGGNQGARDRLLSSCRATPLDIPLLQLCARIEGRAGNIDRANELRYIADAQVGGAYSNGAELRVAEGPIVGQSLQGFPAYFWGTYTYRRSTPFDILVPSLVHLTIK